MTHREWPFCSVIIPCRNEAHFIGRCLDSVVRSTYPKDKLEVLVVDGRSDDGTRRIVEGYVGRYSFIRLLENQRRVTPTALNIGVKGARGSIVVRMDAHAEYPSDYIASCVSHLQRSGADNVGGVIRTVPMTPTLVGAAIAAALSHPFGVGNSAFRTGARAPMWADTVFGGCYRREVFERIGLWNEKLTFGQDLEFNLRLRAAGGRVLLVPEIVSTYFARSDLASFCRHNFRNGVWAILPFAYSTIVPVRWRQLVPGAFVLCVAVVGLLSFSVPLLRWAVALILGLYLASSVVVSAKVAVRSGEPVYALVLPEIFACLHFPYGLGSLWGAVQAGWIRLRDGANAAP